MKKVVLISIIGGVLLGVVAPLLPFRLARAEEPPPPLPAGFTDNLVRDIAQQSGLEEKTVRDDLAKPDLVPYYRDTYLPVTGTGALPAGTGPEAGATAGTAGAQQPKPPPASPPQEAETNCLGSGFRAAVSAFTGRAFECMAAWTANIAMWISARGLWMAGLLLNYTLEITLNLSTLLKSLPIVDIGWQVIRDIANIVFIFIALWSGISIIIGINPERAWGLLGHMVLVALFVNFSLFITKTVVDISNVAALHFYNQIVDPATRNDPDGGLTNAFMNAMKLGTLYNTKLAAQTGTDAGYYLRSVGGGGEKQLGFTNIILIGIFGSFFMIVAGFVFFAAAILFIVRTVTLVMLMILSPLAFVALLLPGASGMAHEWWHKLWSQSFFAPLYLALTYIVVRAINSEKFQGFLVGEAKETSFAASITGFDGGSIHIVFSFILLIGLMVGCLIVAQSLGAKGSEMTMKGWETIKGGAIGVAGATTRGIIKAPSTTIRGVGNLMSGKTASGVGKWMANTRLLNNRRMGDWGKRRGEKLMEKGENWQKSKPGKIFGKASRMAGNALDVRFLEERAGQSWLGQTTIGKGIRAATIGGLANLKIGGKSLEEAHKEGEEQETARHVIGFISKIRQAGSRLRDLREKENHQQEGVHEAQKQVHERKEGVAKAEEQMTPAERAAVAAAETNLERARANPNQPEIDSKKAVVANTDAEIAKFKEELAKFDMGDPIERGRAAPISDTIKGLEQRRGQEQAALEAAEAQPLTPAQQTAQLAAITNAENALKAARRASPGVAAAEEALAKAEENLSNATKALEKFKGDHGAEIEILVRQKSEGFANISSGEYVKYAPKADIIAHMDFEDTPLSHYNAVMADDHVLTETEKEEATHNFLHRINEQAKRGGERTEQYHAAILTLQRELNKFGARREQIMRGMSPQVRADFDRLEERQREIVERLARLADAGVVPQPQAGTPSQTPPSPQGTPHP